MCKYLLNWIEWHLIKVIIYKLYMNCTYIFDLFIDIWSIFSCKMWYILFICYKLYIIIDYINIYYMVTCDVGSFFLIKNIGFINTGRFNSLI